jgi:hypothetical protein
LTLFQNAKRVIIKYFNAKLGEIDQKTVELLTKELANQQINPFQVFNEAQQKAQAYLSSPQNPQPSISPQLANNLNAVKELQEKLKILQKIYGLRIEQIKINNQTKEWTVM